VAPIVFLGTDATERWDLAAFREFAHPYFAKGKAWTFVPRRHVILSPAGDVAWFDEKPTARRTANAAARASCARW
jgi:hypothetical protein